MNDCQKCAARFIGDKRAVFCADCAYAPSAIPKAARAETGDGAKNLLLDEGSKEDLRGALILAWVELDIARERIDAAVRAEREALCDHSWIPRGDFDLGGDRTEVKCMKCGIAGERNDVSGKVYWPAT